jgi:hypothetical protein
VSPNVIRTAGRWPLFRASQPWEGAWWEVSTMLGAGVPPVSPIPLAGDGSWVWALVAIGVVLGALAMTWWARLWGRDSHAASEQTDVASDDMKKAA